MDVVVPMNAVMVMAVDRTGVGAGDGHSADHDGENEDRGWCRHQSS
ncbi:hypothetical protein [Rhodopseudomonas palustris]|nr:hypothetical protein [Rhodopseudomonas palustris]